MEIRVVVCIGGYCELFKGVKEKIKVLEKKVDSFIFLDDFEEVNIVSEIF